MNTKNAKKRVRVQQNRQKKHDFCNLGNMLISKKNAIGARKFIKQTTLWNQGKFGPIL